MIKKLVFSFIFFPVFLFGAYDVGDHIDQNILLNSGSANPVYLYDYSGRVIVLNLWTSSWPSCKTEAPLLETNIWQPYRNEGIGVIAVGAGESESSATQWVSTYNLSYDVFGDPTDQVYYNFGNGYVPYNVVIDQNMIVRYSSSGFSTTALSNAIETALNEPPNTPRDFTLVQAGDDFASFRWPSNNEGDLAGYILFYGTNSGSYTNSINVGNTTEYTINFSGAPSTYYFALKAIDQRQNESGFSNELSAFIKLPELSTIFLIVFILIMGFILKWKLKSY